MLHHNPHRERQMGDLETRDKPTITTIYVLTSIFTSLISATKTCFFLVLLKVSQGVKFTMQFRHRHLLNPHLHLINSQSRFLRWTGQHHGKVVKQLNWHWDQPIAKFTTKSPKVHLSHSQSTLLELERWHSQKYLR